MHGEAYANYLNPKFKFTIKSNNPCLAMLLSPKQANIFYEAHFKCE